MPETLDDFLMTRPPTAERPLLGQTILMVEDSRFACEALRIICQRSGARVRRADSLRSAERHLRTYRPGIVLVDVGLPDGSGIDLIRHLALTDPGGAVVIGMSGDDTRADEAIAAGARSFIAKPIHSVSAFQTAVLAQLPKDARPIDIRPVSTDEVTPDRIALRDDLSLAADLLGGEPPADVLSYVARFLVGLGKSAGDADLVRAATDLAEAVAAGRAGAQVVSALRAMVTERLDAEETV